MPKFQQEEVLLGVEFDQGGPFGVVECRVGTLDDILEIVGRNLVGRNEEGHDIEGEVFEAGVGPALPVLRQRGDLLRNEQATITGKTLHNNLLEGFLQDKNWISESVAHRNTPLIFHGANVLRTQHPGC